MTKPIPIYQPLYKYGMLELLEQMRRAWIEQEKAHADMAKIQARVNNVFQSRLTDLSLIPQLYVWYKNIAEHNRFSSDTRNNNCKQFVFIVLMLYSPQSLYGAKIKDSLRREITTLMCLKSHTILYYMRDKAVVWIKTYKAFSSEVTIAFDEIMDRLRERGLIEP